jgi:lysophospholipase L1-like esterase
MNICIFGDSTAWGAYDLEKGGWVNRLWLFFAKENQDIDVYNLSISGGTTKTILDRFENEAKIRKADVLIFQGGGNDAAYEHAEGNYQVSPEEFKNNLEKIIEKAKKITDKIIFVGFKNIDESRTMPVSWCDFYYTNDNIKKYCEIMKNICDKSGVLFLDIFGILENDDLYDGLHPNAKGHEKIFQKVNDFLISNKIL